MDSVTPDLSDEDGEPGPGCASKVSLLFIPVVAVACYLALGGLLHIKGNSMEPGLAEGSLCFMKPFSAPRRGDIVLVQGPEPHGLVVKRLVAMAGDRPRLSDGWYGGDSEATAIGAREDGQEGLKGRSWKPDRSGAGYDRHWPRHLLSQRHGDGSPARLPGLIRENASFVVAPEHVFLLSDNRDETTDSRDWGALQEKKVVRVIWFCS